MTAPTYDLDDTVKSAHERRTQAREFTDKSSAWFLASSIALNGGAMVALLSAVDKIGFQPENYAFFAVGLLAVLASSAIASILEYRDSDLCADILNEIQSIKDNGTDHTGLHTLIKRLSAHNWFGEAPYLLRLASALAFAAGLLVVGIQLPAQFSHAQTRCAAIQYDMLSAHPRISDGPEKFQALGCRAQGSDPRIIVAPTDRERAAGKALPWGGYPPPP